MSLQVRVPSPMSHARDGANRTILVEKTWVAGGFLW
jgi:hypothetical protein